MQKLPIQQDNTTQSPAGTLAVCVNRQNLSEGTAGAGLLAACAFSFQLVLWVVLLIAYLVPNLITSGFKPIHAASCVCLLRVFWTVKGLQSAYPSQKDWKKKKKKNKYLQGLSFTCFLHWLSQNNQTMQCFLWSLLRPYGAPGECRAWQCVLQQAAIPAPASTRPAGNGHPADSIVSSRSGQKAKSHPLKLYQHRYEGLLQAKGGFYSNVRVIY